MTSAEEKLEYAVRLDPEIRVTRDQIDQCTGATETYLAELGLDRRALKKLERAGIAIRGYLPTKAGHSLRWILIDVKES